jgi:hypothetical protein
MEGRGDNAGDVMVGCGSAYHRVDDQQLIGAISMFSTVPA